MTNTEPAWNLYLRAVGKRAYEIIMPDACGDLSAGQCPDSGFAVRWPVNPRFTGFYGIVVLLQAMDKFKGCTFTGKNDVLAAVQS